jgi:FAD binding domain
MSRASGSFRGLHGNERVTSAGVRGDAHELVRATAALIEQGLKVPTFRVRDRDRALLHIDFDGLPTAFSFTLMCPQYRTERVLLARLEALGCSPRGMAVVAPQPDDRFRIVMATDDAPAHPTLEFLRELLSQRGPREAGRIREVCWSPRFRTHHRVAQVARKGRVLLCGDAAHVHSPAGGQGMNTGIQDAMSLARVLKATLEDGREGRLDAWAAERQGVARDVVKFTDRIPGSRL